MFSVIFDMDGTLLDTQAIAVPAWDFAGKLQGIEGMGECIPFVTGMAQQDWKNYVVTKYPQIDIEKFSMESRKYILENTVVRFMDGAKELLDFLKNSGVKMAIASGSSRDTIKHHLSEVGVFDYFETVVSGYEVPRGKPEPDVFLRAAELIGEEPCNCFVFEDSANGIRAGHAAGMKCIGVADIVPFSDDVKKLMFTELASLAEAIDLLKKYM